MARLVAIVLVMLAGLASAARLSPLRVDPQRHMIYEIDTGRVQKGVPWYPYVDLLNATRVLNLRQWGFTAIRLGCMWTGTVPDRAGVYNETYLKIMDGITANLAQHGMWSLLDMHQDVLSSKFSLYDGAPLWVVDLSVPDHAYPWPLKNITFWSENYLAEAVGRAFQDIYSNAHGSQDYLSQFWDKISAHFAARPEILGYEIINEPWSGDIYKDPSLLLPGEAGRKNLLPMYNNINAVIRKNDNKTLLFYEPITWGMIFDGKIMGSGFDTVPGGSAYYDRSVFSYHYYCWFISGGNDQPYNPLVRAACDKLLGPQVFSNVDEEIKTRLGGASFLTEFGTCNPNDGTNTTDTIECEWVMDRADDYLQSWTYWDAGWYDASGNIMVGKVKAFSRAYARATAGTPLKMAFNTSTSVFTYTYTLDPSIKAPTEIFCPPLHYPNGFIVQTTPNVKFTTPTADVLLVVPAALRSAEDAAAFVNDFLPDEAAAAAAAAATADDLRFVVDGSLPVRAGAGPNDVIIVLTPK